MSAIQSTFGGLKIIASTMAREVRDEWKVERHPTLKKRRNWRVVKHHIDRAGCYRMGNTLIMHPELITRLKSEAMLKGVLL